jgi:hypothetical protein
MRSPTDSKCRPDDRRNSAEYWEETVLREEVERGDHQTELEEAFSQVEAGRAAFLVVTFRFFGLSFLLDLLSVVRVTRTVFVELLDQALHPGRVGRQRAGETRSHLSEMLPELFALKNAHWSLALVRSITAAVWARWEAMVTTERRMPMMPTVTPTRLPNSSVE